MRLGAFPLAGAIGLCTVGMTALVHTSAGAASSRHAVSAVGTGASTGTAPFTGGNIVSEPGDYIGDGQSYLNLTVTATGHYGGYSTYDMSNGTAGFDVVITPPAGQPFVAGTTYSDAQASGSPGFPELDVTGGDRGCNQVVGSFTVYDADYASDGILDSFAVQFFQHCEGDYAALMGNLSYNSDVTLPPLPATAPEPRQEAQFVSQPGDWIGQGEDQTFPIAYPFGDPNRQNPNRWELATTSDSTDFEVDLGGANNAPLALGTYADADRCAGGSADSPCFDLFGESRGCNTESSSFTIYDLSYDSLGMLKSFAAEFIDHCDGDAPALYGAIRWNSNVAMPPRFVSAVTASATVGTPFSFTVRTSGLPVPSLKKSRRLPQGLHFVDNGDGTATISGTPAAGSSGTYRLRIRAITKSGTTRLETKQVFTLVVLPTPADVAD